MIEFIYLFLFRSLSGAQNGFGYARQQNGRRITTFLMELILIGTAFVFLRGDASPVWWQMIFILGGLVISLLGVAGVEGSFDPEWNLLFDDVHFWEVLATGGVTISWVAAGGNLVTIAASVYPALILHKGFVNIGSRKSFFYHGTDDHTGKTYSIPILGWKIPRLSTSWRITLAVASIAAFGLSQLFHFGFSIYTVLGIKL